MTKGCIYYTDFHADEKILNICKEQLRKSFDGEIVSVSLKKPLDFGKNIVLKAERGYPTMVRQIILALENSTADFVFFTEADVLYHPSHFDFNPPCDDIYYYNTHLWRWDYPNNRLIGYEGLTSLSQMCCNRLMALEHYKKRLQKIEELGLDKIKSKEPSWARTWGYEPGTKRRRIGGFSDEKSERWKSEFPNIDIRHNQTFSPPKTTLSSFKHLPNNWQEITLNDLKGWKPENFQF